MFDYLVPISLFGFSTCLFVDALRHHGSLSRPEFYLLLSVYVYGTAGFLGYRYIELESAVFMQAITYDDATIVKAYFYTVIGISAIYLGGLLYKSGPDARHNTLRFNSVYVGVASGAAVLAIFINFYFFSKQGLFAGGIHHADLLEAKKSGFFFPYFYLMIGAISIVALYEERGYYSWLIFGMFAMLNLSGGSRRHVLAALIAIIASKSLKGVRFSKTWLITVFLFALTIGIVAGATRGNLALSDITDRKILQTLTEFVRPNTSLLYYINDQNELLWGKSFWDSMLQAVPGALLPIEKPTNLGTQFRSILGKSGVFPGRRVAGQGFSPVAEILLNLSLIGVPIVFFIFTRIIRQLSVAAIKTRWWILNPVLCVGMFTIGRGGFQSQPTFIFYTLLSGFLILVAGSIVRGAALNCKHSIPKSSDA